MNCKEFEKMIPDYIQKKMDFVTTKHFTEHLKSCPACKEELNIQFLVNEGLNSLEDGDVFDLQSQMSDLMKESDKKIRFHENFLKFGRLIELLVMLGIGIVVFLIIFY